MEENRGTSPQKRQRTFEEETALSEEKTRGLLTKMALVPGNEKKQRRTRGFRNGKSSKLEQSPLAEDGKNRGKNLLPCNILSSFNGHNIIWGWHAVCAALQRRIVHKLHATLITKASLNMKIPLLSVEIQPPAFQHFLQFVHNVLL